MSKTMKVSVLSILYMFGLDCMTLDLLQKNSKQIYLHPLTVGSGVSRRALETSLGCQRLRSLMKRSSRRGPKSFSTTGPRRRQSPFSGRWHAPLPDDEKVYGMFRHGGRLGITKATVERPWFVRLLTRAFKEKVPDAEFAAVYISMNNEREVAY